MHPGIRSACAVLAWCGAAGAAAQVFLTEENPPLNYTRAGQPAGPSVAMVREMARRAGLPPAEIRVQPWERSYAQARDGDACVFSTARVPARLPLFQWVGPIGRGQYSLFAPPGFRADIHHADDLKRFRIGVLNDARAAYLRQRGFPNVVALDSQAEILRRLNLDPARDDAVDLWLTQHDGAQAVASAAGVEVRPVFGGLLTQDYWLACGRRVPESTVRALSTALQEMQRDGTAQRLQQPQR